MVCVDFSHNVSDPKVSHLLAGIAVSIGDEGKSLWQWGGGLKTAFVDYSVREKIFSLTCSILSGKGVFDIKILHVQLFFSKLSTLPWFSTSRNDYCAGRNTIGECLTW